MSLIPGQALSSYEILGPLGAGAMGEVWRARDTRLEREVAIKVLPDGVADDEERLLRFEREAKTLAGLNHPNIAGIYGVDRQDDVLFIALELVPGEDLAARLARGPLPLDEALDLCRQVAEGLEAAHEAGVVHRDLKPANLGITPDGVVKLLDFGLAKPARPGGEDEASRFATSAEGLALGTPTYMSPEQARGRPIDRRADVWAFGCVLFECLTGRRAHDGAGVAEIMASVLERGWDRDALPAGTPAHVVELLERCLDKDPRQRLRDIGEARVRLERDPRQPARARVSTAPPRTALAVGAALLLAGGFGVARLWSTDRPAGEITLARLTELVGMEELPTVSPDGRALAFVARVDGKRQVWLRLMAEGSPKPFTAVADGEFAFPRWADSNTLVYYQYPEGEEEDGTLWEALVLGSTPPRQIGPVQGEADVSQSSDRLATLRRDAATTELILFDRADPADRRVIPLSDGPYRTPRWSPDDRWVALVRWGQLNFNQIVVADVESGDVRTLTPAGQVRGLAWLPGGDGLVYSSSQGSTMAYPPTFGLWVVRLDAPQAPRRLPLTDAGFVSYVEPDISPAGLVASRIEMRSDVHRFPVDGTPTQNVDAAERITRQTGMVQVPSASPDGTQVAYLSDSGGHSNIWVATTDGSAPPRRLTEEQDPDTTIAIPVWSPVEGDDRIVYWKGRSGDAEQWLIRADGTDNRKLCPTRGGAIWSHDGEWIYHIPASEGPLSARCEKVHVATGRTELVRVGVHMMGITANEEVGYFSLSELRFGEIWKASPAADGPVEALLEGLLPRIPLWPHHYTLSPDGAWLATPLIDNGTTNLWRFSTQDGALQQLTDFGQRSTLIARAVSWSGDSAWIFAALVDRDADVVLLEGALALAEDALR